MDKHDSESNNTPDENDKTPSAPDDRRNFLTKSSMLLAVLAGAGLAPSTGFAQGKTPASIAEVKALQSVVRDTLDSGDLNRALRVHGKRLEPEIVETLRQLTPEDWRAAANLHKKLNRIEDLVKDNNNGVIGM